MRRVELTPLIAAASAGVAAWISFGSLAVAATATDSRFGFLPPLWLAPVLAFGFALAAWRLRLTRATALPLFFSLVLLLPWIPGRVPAAFLIWTGRVVFGVWIAVIAGMVIAKRGRESFSPGSAEKDRRPLFAAAMAFAAYLAGAWWLSPILPGGDEPHYLVIAQSLLHDGDLRIENNHAAQQYREFFDGTLRPHYLKRGVDGEIYSIHAPGLAAVVAPSFALFGYPGVVVFLALVAATGSALLWRASYQLTGSASAAWFAWAAGALSVPFFFEAFAVFPDGLGATVVLFAALPLFGERPRRSQWIATGAALALLPWLHTRFAVIAATLGFVLLLRLVGSPAGRSRIAPFLMVPVVSAIGWFGFFRLVYGRFDPSAPYGSDTQTKAMNILNGLPALLLDQQFGVLPIAPVYGFCFAGLVVLARRRARLAAEISVVAIAYLLAVSAFHMWWGGASAPARFLAPILPLLAVPAAWLWSATSHRSTRAVGVAALLMSLVATAVLAGAEGGLLAYNVRDGYARAAEWINPVIDISLGMPSFFQQTAGGAVRRAAVWIAVFAAAVAALRLIERMGGTRAAFALTTPVLLACAIMGALTGVWALEGVEAPNPEKSQLALLGAYDSAQRPHGITMQPLRLEAAEAVLTKITVATPVRRGPPSDGTLLLAPAIIPGGVYALRLGHEGPASGTASLVIGRLARPSRTWNLANDFRDGAATLDLPVSVGSLVITGDRRALEGGLTLHPTRVWEGSSRLTSEIGRRVERYGQTLVIFFDLNTFPEVPGFWVRGGREAHFAVAPSDRGAALRIFVRNAAAVNRVRIEIDGVEQMLDLQPREERILPFPIADNRQGAVVRIHSQTGFHPSEVEPGSTDTRFLGAWIEFR